MKKNPVSFFPAAAVLILTALILVYPSQCISYAFSGLNLWFQKMIPTLFPFMVLSGIMIRMNLTKTFVRLLRPVLSPIFRVNSNCLYVIVVGFLCGFPMGAHVTAQLYERQQITRQEAGFLLSFCNNIGPVYFLSFALPTLGITGPPFLFLLGMYGLPLFYGVFLRYTIYAHKLRISDSFLTSESSVSFLQALDESVMSSLTGITKLGGYMIVFNLLNVLPSLLFNNGTINAVISCLLEITGGLKVLGNNMPFAGLCLISFGGLSCLAQTYGMIKDTDLSLKNYTIHRMILTAVSVIYYVTLI